MRTSWKHHAETMLDEPLRMKYEGLDPAARYVLRVTYGGDGLEKPIRCVADDEFEIHPYI
jgi:hypothetical protein